MKIKRILKHIITCLQVFSAHHLKILSIAKPEIENRALPHNYNSADSKYFSHESRVAISETKMIEGKNVIITSEGVLLKNSKIISKSFSGKEFDEKIYVPNLYWSKIKKTFSEKKLVAIFTIWSDNYYHWFTEALPKIILFTKIDTNSYTYILPQSHNKSFIIESLNALGLSYVFFKESEFAFCKNLKFITLTAPLGHFRPRVQRQLSDLLKNTIKIAPVTPHRKIYISRSLAPKRFVKNEDSLLPILIENGFEIIHLETMTLVEQIKTMHEAKTIVGLHGAGLTNMMFMQPQSKILEIRLEGDTHMNLFYSLAQSLDLKYYYQFAPGDITDIHLCNLIVDPIKLEILLNEMEHH